MTRYRISWETVLKAADPQQAAARGLSRQLAPSATHRVYTVARASGADETEVMLYECGDDLVTQQVRAACREAFNDGYASAVRWANHWRARAETNQTTKTHPDGLAQIHTAWNQLTDKERLAITARMPRLAQAITTNPAPDPDPDLDDPTTPSSIPAPHTPAPAGSA